MRKTVLVIFSFITLASFYSQAKILFSCEGTFKVMAPGKKLHLKLSQSPTKEFKMEKDGVEVQNGPNEEISSFEPNLDGISEFIKCDAYDSPCRDRASKGKGKGFSDFANIMSMAKSLERDVPEAKGSNTLVNLKLSEIKFGKSYVFITKGKPSQFGNMGVYEYYDKSNKLLGRYISAMEVLDCKDKTTPSKLTPVEKFRPQPSSSSGTAH